MQSEAPTRAIPVGYGMVDGEPLFLDLNSDSYFLLPPAERDAFLLQQTGADRGQTSPGAPCKRPPPLEARPHAIRTSIMDLPALPLSAGTVLECWSALRQAKRDLAREPLANLVRPFIRSAIPASLGSTRVVERARAIASARHFVPQPRHCLADSLALLRMLARRGASATLVFGAKLNPFAAHCWVQSGDLLLNDRCDTVARFTPVLVIPE